jgi:hypothetical protein
MQFRKEQREAVARSWGMNSWFYLNLGQPIRDVIERAYGLKPCTPKERAASQEVLTTALSVFAQKIGAEKSHCVHALLTGRLDSLMAALGRKQGASFSSNSLKEAWISSFREVIIAG